MACRGYALPQGSFYFKQAFRLVRAMTGLKLGFTCGKGCLKIKWTGVGVDVCTVVDVTASAVEGRQVNSVMGI